MDAPSLQLAIVACLVRPSDARAPAALLGYHLALALIPSLSSSGLLALPPSPPLPAFPTRLWILLIATVVAAHDAPAVPRSIDCLSAAFRGTTSTPPVHESRLLPAPQANSTAAHHSSTRRPGYQYHRRKMTAHVAARQPFAALDGPRLHTLSSAKNRQNCKPICSYRASARSCVPSASIRVKCSSLCSHRLVFILLLVA